MGSEENNFTRPKSFKNLFHCETTSLYFPSSSAENPSNFSPFTFSLDFLTSTVCASNETQKNARTIAKSFLIIELLIWIKATNNVKENPDHRCEWIDWINSFRLTLEKLFGGPT